MYSFLSTGNDQLQLFQHVIYIVSSKNIWSVVQNGCNQSVLVAAVTLFKSLGVAYNKPLCINGDSVNQAGSSDLKAGKQLL